MKRLSNDQLNVIVALLVLVILALSAVSAYIDAKAHRMANIPNDQNYVVLRDGDQYYYRPTGPFDLRSTITEQQYLTYHRIMSRSNWFHMAAALVMLSLFVVATRYDWGDNKPNAS